MIWVRVRVRVKVRVRKLTKIVRRSSGCTES